MTDDATAELNQARTCDWMDTFNGPTLELLPSEYFYGCRERERGHGHDLPEYDGDND